MLRTIWAIIVAIVVTIPCATTVLHRHAVVGVAVDRPVIRFWARVVLWGAGIEIRGEGRNDRSGQALHPGRESLQLSRHPLHFRGDAAADPVHGQDQPIQDPDLRLGTRTRGLHPHRPQEPPHGGEVVRPGGGSHPQRQHDRDLSRGGPLARRGCGRFSAARFCWRFNRRRPSCRSPSTAPSTSFRVGAKRITPGSRDDPRRNADRDRRPFASATKDTLLEQSRGQIEKMLDPTSA